MADAIRADGQLIRMLRGLLPRFGSLADADFDEDAFEARLRDPRMAITACWYWIRKLQARFYGNDFAGAVAAAENAAPLLWTSAEFFETAEYHFYAALAHAARHDEVAPEERARHREALVAHARRLGEWARQCPANFRSRAALADAEIARIEGRVADAERLYESALTSARANGFAQNEAIAYEMAARFWRARGHPLFGDAFVQRGLRALPALGRRGEGAAAHPPLPGARQAAWRSPPPLSLAELPATSPDQLDLLAVIKASQTISGVMGRKSSFGCCCSSSSSRAARDGRVSFWCATASSRSRPSRRSRPRGRGRATEPAAPAPRATAGRVPASILSLRRAHPGARGARRRRRRRRAVREDPYLAAPVRARCCACRSAAEGGSWRCCTSRTSWPRACSPPTGSWRWSSSPPQVGHLARERAAARTGARRPGRGRGGRAGAALILGEATALVS